MPVQISINRKTLVAELLNILFSSEKSPFAELKEGIFFKRRKNEDFQSYLVSAVLVLVADAILCLIGEFLQFFSPEGLSLGCSS